MPWLPVVAPLLTVRLASPVAPCDSHPSSRACPRGQQYHRYRRRCLHAPAPLTRPSVFLGCYHKPSDCAIFDFEFAGRFLSGNGEACLHARNVRCVSKEAPRLDSPTPANLLRIVSYNIWELPFIVTRTGQRERTCRIPRELVRLQRDLDVITIQEAFMGGCFYKQAPLRALLTQHGFPYQTHVVSDHRHPLTGGTFIASRWQILEEDQFTSSNDDLFSSDFFASKGVSYAKIQKDLGGISGVYHVMATHFQAGIDPRHSVVRVKQSLEWGRFVRAKRIPPNEAIIFTGDFNVNYETQHADLMNVANNLGAAIPKRTAPENKRQWVDYIMYSRLHKVPRMAFQHFLEPQGHGGFPVCFCAASCPLRARCYTYPTRGSCTVAQRIHISDHPAISGKLVF